MKTYIDEILLNAGRKKSVRDTIVDNTSKDIGQSSILSNAQASMQPQPSQDVTKTTHPLSFLIMMKTVNWKKWNLSFL